VRVNVAMDTRRYHDDADWSPLSRCAMFICDTTSYFSHAANALGHTCGEMSNCLEFEQLVAES